MRIQDDALQRIMDNNEELAPLQREQLAFGLKTGRQAWQQSQDDRQWALKKRGQLDLAQQGILDAASGFSEGDRRRTLMGEATGDITQAFGLARKQADMDMSRLGVDPASGRSVAARSEMGTAEALARVAAGRKVSEAARAEGLQLKGRAADMLSGYPTMASGLTTSGAGLGANGLAVANTGLAGLNSGWGVVGSGAGALGQNASTMYNTQQTAATAANNAEASSTGALIGGAATVAAAFI